MICILTPTFNRRHTLTRLYESLEQQTERDFEWLVVDDGSTDDTVTLINLLSKTASFPLRYVHQDNGGKHAAINNGVKEAAGNVIFIVDRDDALTGDAVFCVANAFRGVSEDVVGVCFRKSYFNGDVIGNDMHGAMVIRMHPSLAGKYFGGDLAYVFTKRSLLENPFPVIEGEKFVPELYIWNLIADQGSILYHSGHSVYLCEYLPDGYSANFKKHFKANPRGFRLFYYDQLRRETTVAGRLKCAIRVLQCSYHAAVKRMCR